MAAYSLENEEAMREFISLKESREEFEQSFRAKVTAKVKWLDFDKSFKPTKTNDTTLRISKSPIKLRFTVRPQ
jgi:hypothetical protein